MINEQLLKYIRSQREAGIDDSTIKDNLRSAGWKNEDITEGFQAVDGDGAEGSSPQDHQEVRQQATSNRQSSQSSESGNSKSASKSDRNQSKEKPTEDKYREPIEEGGRQDSSTDSSSQPTGQSASRERSASQKKSSDISDGKGARPDKNKQKSPGASSGNKSMGSRPVRTMEDDKKRAGAGGARKQQRQVSGGDRLKKAANAASANKRNRKPSQKKGVDRQAKDGRRRFAATSDKKQAKKRARRKKRASKGSGSKLASIALFVLTLLLVGGGGAYAYFTYFQGPTVNATAKEAMTALQSAGTFQYRITVESAESNNSSGYVIEGAVDLNPGTEAQTYYTITQSGTSKPPIRAVSSEVSEYATLDPRKQKVVTETLTNPDFLTVENFQAREKLAESANNPGLDTNRFGVTLQPTAVVSAYERIHQAIFGKNLPSDLRQQLGKAVGEFTPRRGQMWLDRKTGVPYQITLIGSTVDGQSKQINIQFKNHGSNIGSTPSYESRSLASILGEMLGTSTSSKEMAAAETENNQSQLSDSSTSTGDTNQKEGSEVNLDQRMAEEENSSAAKRRDQLRINDIQQLSIALDIYANTNDEYPSSLQQLRQRQGQVVSKLIRDPQGGVYVYAVSEDGSRYHLGATLEATSRENTFNDANYNSRAQELPDGFDGAANTCRSSGSSGQTCYDITAITN